MSLRGGTTDERQANPKLCAAIATKLPGWVCDAERKHLVVDQPALTPDLTFSRGSAWVLGESKWEHRDTSGELGVESNARARLGIIIEGNPNPVEHCLAIRMPESLVSVSHQELFEAFLETKDLQWSLVSEDGVEEVARFPDLGWLDGGVEQLANTIEAVPVSRRAMERAYGILRTGVINAGKILMKLTPEERMLISHELFTMSHDEQTMMMASTIVCNALLFQLRLQEHIPDIELINCYIESDHIDWVELKKTWKKILDKNYAPIFEIASKALKDIPDHIRAKTLSHLARTARKLNSVNVDPSHDLVGRVFQWMFADRQKLATYYTRPESATLLAEYAVSKLSVDWNNLERVKNLVVADFACGTGTLLAAAYQAILSKVRRTGSDPSKIHAGMMERGLIGLDVLPTATHMTTAILASNFPDIKFANVRIATAPYGRWREGMVLGSDKEKDSVFIGSLEFLDLESGSALFDSIIQQSGSAQNTGAGFDQFTSFELPNESVDLVIMNPPFSTQTHSSGNYIEPWAAFETTKAEQIKMNNKFDRIREEFKKAFGLSGTGYAGIAANFFDLGFMKLRPEGVIAMVAPLTLVRGSGWENTRKLLNRWFDDLTVFSLAPDDQETKTGKGQSFSADTGMAECLVVGVKRKVAREGRGEMVTSLSMYHRPRSSVESKTLSDLISRGGGGGESCMLEETSLEEHFVVLSIRQPGQQVSTTSTL